MNNYFSTHARETISPHRALMIVDFVRRIISPRFLRAQLLQMNYEGVPMFY